MKNKPKRKHSEEMRKTLYFGFLAVIIAFAYLIGKLVYINNVNGDRYARAVLSQKIGTSQSMNPTRGQILDRNGIVLAKSIKNYDIIIDPKQICEHDYYINPSVAAIVDGLGYDEQEVRDLIENNKDRYNVIVEKGVGYDRVAAYNEAKSKRKFAYGVHFEEHYERVYPFSSLASHVIGFMNTDGTGNCGLEKYYDETLTGTEGMSYSFYDAELQKSNVIKEATDGNNLRTTIDYNIQTVIEKKIDTFRNTIGCNNIGIIIMDPNNGEVLGMASNQEFDLNNPRDLSAYFTEEELENMSVDDQMNARYKLWRNFCVSDSYEPGSTFKTVTVASALEESVIRTKDTFYCGGYSIIGGWRIGCNNKYGHGYLSTTEALMKSCNCALMEIVEKLGRDNFFRYQKMFGFGAKTGIDTTGETTGIVIDKKNLNVTELATSSFGTTFNVSPIQMAAAYCSLVNGGTYYKPHLVKEIITSEGSVIQKYENMAVRQTVSEETSEFVRNALLATVMDGTAKPAKVAGYLVGGKTGTAQKRPRTEKKYIVSFAGFAPADNPQVVMYVVIDEIHDPEKAGSSSSATSMTSEVFKEILPYLGLYPEGDIEYVIDETILGEIGAQFDENDESNLDVIPDEYSEEE